jgi:ribonuclease E
MLDHEPEGGERAGVQPSGETAGQPEKTPVRRARTTRRRSTTDGAAEAPAAVPADAVASGEAASPEVPAPPAEAAAAESAEVKPTRRRRKAVAPAAETGAPADMPAEAPPPVKATRTRRKKAVPAVEPPAPTTEPAEPEVVEPEAAPAVEPEAVEPVELKAQPVGAELPTPVPATAAASSSAEPAAELSSAEPAAEEPAKPRRRAKLTAPAVLFMAPEPETPLVRPVAPPPAAFAAPIVAEESVAAGEGEAGEPEEIEAETIRRRRRGRRTAEPVESDEPVVVVPVEEAADLDEEDEDEEGEETVVGRRRRRRGRRGRGRGKGTVEEPEEEPGEAAEVVPEGEAETGEQAESEEEETETADGVTRRRRRRRRKGAGETEGIADDGVPTVVKIREPRRTVDEVQGVSGSTRLEAKRQRRRDGREQRRTRPPILSESEFLARREAVDRSMVIRQRGDRTQIAVLEDGVLVEHYVSRSSSGTMAGNVYLGKVQNVLPSMEAAFVDIGRGRNAVLYAGEVNWDSSGLEGRARSIEQALRPGDSVLVQVTKDPIGHKGARLTSHIALSGRHLVYVPNGNASGISRKLPDTERKRLRDILKKLVPDGAGVIVRTAAEGASEDDLARDIKRLQAQWEDIQAKAAAGGAPALLYGEPDLVIRVVRDLFNEDFRELVVQGDGAYEMVDSYLSHVSPDLMARLHRYTGTGDIFAERRIDEQILKGLDRRVFLPSGGHLVIDRTEAMTVIDVNTGKYTGAGGNLEETVTRNNLEAAEEIVRQLRLRDLGGIVVIDFIDMVLESNRELVLRRLTECLGRDRTKHQVTEITSLGLVQMTRKRIGAGLLEAFSETCECCKGRGVIIHPEPVPEKPRHGGGDKGKAAVPAPAPVAAVAPAATTSTRRRGRKGTSERVVVAVAEDDTMGYDLSRYEIPAADVSSTPAEEPAVDGVPGSAETSVVDDAPASDGAPTAPEAMAPGEPAGTDQAPEAPEATAEPMRLAGADDPDALSAGEHPDDLVDNGRRRTRRSGGTRRRSRP